MMKNHYVVTKDNDPYNVTIHPIYAEKVIYQYLDADTVRILKSIDNFHLVEIEMSIEDIIKFHGSRKSMYAMPDHDYERAPSMILRRMEDQLKREGIFYGVSRRMNAMHDVMDKIKYLMSMKHRINVLSQIG